ncbi:MAG: hypothetical protein ACRDBA_02730 [Clostridium sp.]
MNKDNKIDYESTICIIVGLCSTYISDGNLFLSFLITVFVTVILFKVINIRKFLK